MSMFAAVHMPMRLLFHGNDAGSCSKGIRKRRAPMVRTSTWCCRPGSSSSSQCVVVGAGESWWAVWQCCRGTQHCTSDNGRAADEGARARRQELQLDPCAEQDTRLQEQQGAAPTRVWADVGRRRGVG